MENEKIMWIVIGVLIVAIAFVLLSNKSGVTGSATKQLDTSGWTADEKMNYEMHGQIPARVQQSSGAQAPQSQMVGGC